MIRFDHIEVHVNEVKKYCDFLVRIFEGGTYIVISKSGTSMFTSPEGLNIEVKKKKNGYPLGSGFCNPCLRRSNAKNFILELELEIVKELTTPDGPVFFFLDHEGIQWHLKDKN